MLVQPIVVHKRSKSILIKTISIPKSFGDIADFIIVPKIIPSIRSVVQPKKNRFKAFKMIRSFQSFSKPFWQHWKRPRYIKFHRDIELVFEDDEWIIRDNLLDKIVLRSLTDAFCPTMIPAGSFEEYDFKNDCYSCVTPREFQERIFTC